MNVKTKQAVPAISVSHCSVTNTTAPANEHTRAAIESLALAAKANADAIAEIAKALRGGKAKIDAGFHIGEPIKR